jgi:hypothetical protein
MVKDLNNAFALINLVGALIIAILMVVTTPNSSIRRAFHHDKQAMWALLRRVLNISNAGGLMGMALWVFEGWIEPSAAGIVFWFMLVTPYVIMLMLRASGTIDQDKWVGFKMIGWTYFNQLGWFGLKGKLRTWKGERQGPGGT